MCHDKCSLLCRPSSLSWCGKHLLIAQVSRSFSRQFYDCFWLGGPFLGSLEANDLASVFINSLIIFVNNIVVQSSCSSFFATQQRYLHKSRKLQHAKSFSFLWQETRNRGKRSLPSALTNMSKYHSHCTVLPFTDSKKNKDLLIIEAGRRPDSA